MDYESTRETESELGLGNLAPEIAAAAVAGARAGATPLLPGPDNTVILPDGASLNDIRVQGRDLVITLEDGRTFVIPDGAVYVPQIVAQGVAVPPLNLAALLVGSEPEPAAGPVRSSGGNFAVPVGPIQAAYKLGDLLPYTELKFPEPERRELFPDRVNRTPDVEIEDGSPPAKNAVDEVNEAGLPGNRTGNVNPESPGSATGNNSHITDGRILIVSPDGIGSVTINGITVTGQAGQVIDTPRGTLVLGALADGQIPYVYTLKDNTSGDATSDVFTVIVTDPDGDSSTATLTINIIDDVPTARNDTDSVPAQNYQPQTGNVTTGAGTTSGAAGADTPGADGATVTGFFAGTTGTTFTTPGTQINGQYGTLTLNADGSYTYTRATNTPGGVSDVFTYRVTDGDGDTSTATLTINIADAPTTITFVPEIGDGTEVLESFLPPRGSEPEGSQFDGDGDVTSSTITFVSPDGVSSVSIGGTTLTPGSLPQTVVSNSTGILVITGYTYDPVTGQGSISYTYTLLDNTLNTNGSTVSFPIVVTDLDSDSASDTLDIRIIDDAPTARDDSGSQTVEDAPITVNVIANDTTGADGVNLTTGVVLVADSLTGAGSVTYNGDGTFTYTPAPGEEGEVTFQYQITDGDGDPSVATVTITLLPDSVPSIEVIGENVVFEAGLPARGSEPEGSDEPADSETTSGTLAIDTGNDTVKTLVIGGVDVTAGGTVTGDHGTLTVTLNAGVYSYSYTLTDNTAGDSTTDSFTVEVTDSDDDVDTTDLVIEIRDDEPSAVNDTDTVPGGTLGPATGNVITDNAPGDAGDLDDGADTRGADGAEVTGIVSSNEPGNTATYDELTQTFTIQGEYGTLTIEADGDYSYLRNEGTPGSVEDEFTYTITDGDGDVASATLTIFIDDNAPETGENPTALLDDDTFLGGNPGGDGDRNPDTANLSGTLAGSGGDGALTWSFLTTGFPAGFTYQLDGDDLQVWQGATKVLTITLDPSNGDYTVTQNAPIDHSVAGTEDNQLFTLNYQVEDADGDKAFGILQIDVDDDSPKVDVSITAVAEPVLTTYDAGTDGSPSAQNSASSSAAFGGVFGLTSAAGADGGATPSLSYTLGVTASASGLESHDAPIYLYKIGALVVGSTSSTQAGVDATNTVFDIAVSGSGVVTLTQYQQVDHALEETTTSPFDDQIVGLADGLVTLTASATITDGDLDTASDSETINIGANLRFADDGPDITAALVGGATIRVDETDGIAAAGGEIDPLGGNLGSVTLSAASLFTVSQPGTSADAPTVLSYGFKITEGASSGLLRSSDNATIVLHDAGGGVIEGRVGTTAGALAFTVSIDPVSGEVTLTQYIAVEHGNTASHDEDSSGLTSGALLIEIKATDFDGDTDTATVDLGSVIRFEDDGPTLDVSRTTAPEPVLATQDAETIAAATDTATSSAAFGGVFQLSSAPGSDGANSPSLSYALSLAVAAGTNSGLTIGGTAIKLYNVGGVIVGSTAASAPASATDASVVFSIAVNGSGVVTLSQLQQIDHPIGSDPSPTLSPFADHQILLADGLINLTASATITDNDGDTATDSETIDLGGNIRFDDDGPTANSDVDSVTEDGPSVADGNVFTGSGGSDINSTDGVADSIGADGPATGGAVTAISGGTVGTPFATTYGTLVLNANGTYTYTLDNTKLAVQQLGTGETRQEVFTYTITDRDGDTATATLTITINGANDAPVVGTATVAVSDEGLNPGIADNAGNPTDTTDNNIAIGQITISDVDGEAHTVTLGTPSGALSYNNTAITWSGVGTDQLIGSVGATQVVIITIADDGLFSVELLQPIDHPDGLQENVATITVPVSVSDGTATTGSTITVNFEDDSPIAVAATTSGTVDEDGLANGIEGGTGDVLGTAVTATGSVTSLFQSGADTPLTYALSIVGQTLPTLTSGGVAVTYAVTTTATGTLLTASAGAGNTVFTLALNSTSGAWTFTLERPLDHTSGNGENDLVLQFGSLVTATDADGDQVAATGSLTVTVDDDSPTVSASTTQPGLSVDETTLTNNASLSFASVFTVGFGADGAAVANSLTYALGISASGANSGLVDTLSGQAVLLYMNGTTVEGRTAIGNQVVFVVSVDANGTVTLDQQRAVVHDPNLGPNDTETLLADNLVTLTATATDRDGDSQSATANIGQNLTFVDDVPVMTISPTDPVTSLTATGDFSLAIGADGRPVGTLLDSFIDVALLSGTVNGQPITVTSVGPLSTTANTSSLVTYAFTFTYDGDPSTAGNQAVSNSGTLTLNTVTGKYSVTIDDPVQTSVTVQTNANTVVRTTFDNEDDPSVSSGPEVTVAQLLPNFFVQFSGQHSNSDAGFTYSGGSGGTFSAPASYVSISGSSNGVASDTIAQNDVLELNFFTQNPGGDLSSPTEPKALAEAVFIEIDQFGNSEDMVVVLKLVDPANPGTIITRTFVASNSDFYTINTGSPAGYNFTFDQDDAVLVIEGNDYRLPGDPVTYQIVGMQIVTSTQNTSGLAYDLNGQVGSTGGIVDVTANPFANNGVTDDNDVTKIVNIGFVLTQTNPQPLTLNFTVTATDADGDSTGVIPLSVTYPAGVMPIVLDLDGDGVEYLGLGAGVTYDYLGDGTAEATAWAGADDGLLAIDANGNGSVDSASEFVFGGNGVSDLQGVAATYDSNGDGVLDAQDSAFAQFGVWQDADSDGVSDAGEFRSLTDLGITSIDLTSDGQVTSEAGGDVTVLGESSYTLADGTTGLLADAVFATEDQTMDSLLSVGGSSAGGDAQTTQDLPVLAEVLADTVDAHAVDSIVEHFAQGSAGAMDAVPNLDHFALQGLLEANVGGIGDEAGAMSFKEFAALDHEQAAALA